MKLKNRQIIIETTNICDAHCITCPREKFDQRPGSMHMDLFKKIIDDAKKYDLESLDLCGYGDCFLDKNVLDRWAYASENIPGVNIFISTNAYHMTPGTWPDVRNLVGTLKLSIYGVSKEIYEAFHRGNVTLERSIENILGYLDYAKDAARKPHTIGLYLETDLNRCEKWQWVDFWESRLDEIFIWKPHNWVEGRNYRKIDKENQRTCGRPDNGPMYIQVDGTVSPCCFDIMKQMPMGNIKNQTIEEIYRGEPYNKIREAHRKGDFKGYPCENCDQTNYDPSVLIYKSDKTREVGQITSNRRKVI